MIGHVEDQILAHDGQTNQTDIVRSHEVATAERGDMGTDLQADEQRPTRSGQVSFVPRWGRGFNWCGIVVSQGQRGCQPGDDCRKTSPWAG